MPYRYFNARISLHQDSYNERNDQLFNYIKSIAVESDAETLWLDMRAHGNTLSQSTFNKRLKNLVEAGLVERRSTGYNKYLYKAVVKQH